METADNVKFQLKLRSNQKTFRMYFDSKGQLTVSAPAHTPTRLIYEFVNSHRHWIEKNKCSIKTLNYEDGELIPFNGEYHQVFYSHLFKGSSLSGDELHIRVRENATKDEKKKKLLSFYKKITLEKGRLKLDVFSDLLKLKTVELRSNNAKTRWGSCKKDTGLITLSAMDAALPDDLFDMICLHELCHTVHPDHSSAFYAMMERYMPDFRVGKKRLEEFSKAFGVRSLF